MYSRALRGAAAATAMAALALKAGLVALDVTAMGAKGDGVTDDTAAIQATLNEVAKRTTAYATISKPGTYMVSKVLNQSVSTNNGLYGTALAHPLNVAFYLAPGVTVKLANNSNCSIIRNVSGASGDDGIVLIGGTWDGNNANQTQNTGTEPRWAGHGLVYLNCTRPLIADLRLINHYKYALYTVYCLDATIGDVSLDTASDGVHCEAMRGHTTIGVIRGKANDQALAWLHNAGADAVGIEYYGNEVNIPTPFTMGTMECAGIRVTGGLTPFRAAGGIDCTFKPFRIGPCSGTVDTGDFAQLSDDGRSLTGAVFEGAHFESIDAVVPAGYSLLRLGAVGQQDVTVGKLRTTLATNTAITVEATVKVTLQAGYSGTPTKGATITQQTSGATGKVKGIIGSTLYLTWVSGTWTPSGSLTLTQSNPSGWTATGTAAVVVGGRSATIGLIDTDGNTSNACVVAGPLESFDAGVRGKAGASGGSLMTTDIYGVIKSLKLRGIYEGNGYGVFCGNSFGRTVFTDSMHWKAGSGGSIAPHYSGNGGKMTVIANNPVYQIGTGTVNQAVGNNCELQYLGSGDVCLDSAGVPLAAAGFPGYAFVSGTGAKIRIDNPSACTEVTNTGKINDPKQGDLCRHNGGGGTLTDAGRLTRYTGSAWANV